jgi:L-ascorbate metabolism protein UlaG (beta-lactamase superfamily)
MVMKIQRLSTVSYKFFSPGGKIVVVDPWLTNDPLWPLSERTPEKLKEIDVVAITHGHFDHASGVNEILQQNENIFVIAQFEYAFALQGRGVKNVAPTNYGATVDYQGIKFSMVSATHTSTEMDSQGRPEIVGTASGYVIEFENGEKVYVSGDTGLTADMKFVVADYFKPDISILPVIGLFMMEPDQAAYAANIIGSKYVIPSHDFPKELSEAANPQGYSEFVQQFPVQDTYKKVEQFQKIIKENYPHIETVYVPIGETREIGG